ncbi:nucleotide excision repair endonuclease [Candidatus Nitrospira salsa]
MGMNLFDKVFGKEFLGSVPSSPGVYEFKVEAKTIYVGKAKNLRDRFRQYRNTTRKKAHRKMREMVRVATALTFHVVESEKEALLLENQLIQELKPTFNISGAFSFMYPALGVGYNDRVFYLCYSTDPEAFVNTVFKMHGVYRSRDLTKEAYYSLVRILNFLGHREPSQRLKKFPKIPYTNIAGFRQLHPELAVELSDFLNGRNRNFLRVVINSLLEKTIESSEAGKIQKAVNSLVEFFREEANRLRKAKKKSGCKSEFLSQKERDRTFILARFAE